MGTREQAAGIDFSEFLEEEVESRLKEAAVVSMGTEVSVDDVANILQLCDQVIALAEYRAQVCGGAGCGAVRGLLGALWGCWLGELWGSGGVAERAAAAGWGQQPGLLLPAGRRSPPLSFCHAITPLPPPPCLPACSCTTT